MNVYDSARMAGLLAPMGYSEVAEPADADLVILNTCHIREKAAEKVYSELGRLNLLRREKAAAGRRMTIAVAGCVAQAEGVEIRRRAPYVDIVFGPQTYHRLPQMVARIESGRDEAVIDTEFPVESKFDFLPEELSPPGASAFLAVQEGCDKFCSFCVVPYTRGAEYSRPQDDVLREAARLVAAGAREIVLVGQNVNAYHGPDATGQPSSLSRLIYALAELPGLMRLRYTTSHPLELGDDLIAAHRDVAILMPFLHLPVQSGSDRILGLMQRRHSADHYRRLVDRLRQARPDLAMASDFIVGFPGESDADFQATLALVRDIGFAQAYSFMYSPRPGTPAAALVEDQVPEAVKAARLAELQALIGDQQFAFNRAQEGRELAVLFDRPGRRAGQLWGRSPYMQAVHVTAPEALMGGVAKVEIARAHAVSLEGRLGRDMENAA